MRALLPSGLPDLELHKTLREDRLRESGSEEFEIEGIDVVVASIESDVGHCESAI
jgi:hypothetical protein